MTCVRKHQMRIGRWFAKKGLWMPRRPGLAVLLVTGFYRHEGVKYAIVTNVRRGGKAYPMLLRTLRRKYRRMTDWLGRGGQPQHQRRHDR